MIRVKKIAAVLMTLVILIGSASALTASAATKVESAVSWALSIAANDKYGYDQAKRWGPDYDCSSLVISAFQQAGIPVKTNGATYTGDMRSVFLKTGFKDVTSSITASSGKGLQKGDVLLTPNAHTALVSSVSGSTITLVHAVANEKGTATGGKAGDQTGKEICTRSYNNRPWTYVLRYSDSASSTPTVSYFPKYTGSSVSIVDALKAVNVSDTSLAYRTKIATANGISGYTGTAAQNTSMLNLLKNGALKKP
jgi:hypothetical protein